MVVVVALVVVVVALVVVVGAAVVVVAAAVVVVLGASVVGELVGSTVVGAAVVDDDGITTGSKLSSETPRLLGSVVTDVPRTSVLSPAVNCRNPKKLPTASNTTTAAAAAMTVACCRVVAAVKELIRSQ